MMRPEVMQVGYLLHTQPTELSATHGTRHVIARAVVHFDDKCTTPRTRLDLICITSMYNKICAPSQTANLPHIQAKVGVSHASI